MGEIVNLRRARKSKARLEREKEAAASRARHGAPKKMRLANEAETRKHIETVEAHRMEKPADSKD